MENTKLRTSEIVLRKYLMEILVCPICSGGLKLVIHEEIADEIAEGSLYCEPCGTTFQIHKRIANLHTSVIQDPKGKPTTCATRGNRK